jgi:ubiquinone/menaquinone biosynthesis C-methylase UbiE
VTTALLTVPSSQPMMERNLRPPFSEERSMRTCTILTVLLTLPMVFADEPAKKPEAPKRYEFKKDHDPDGIGKFYMGREIAQVMGYPAAGWLERTERVKEEEPAKLYTALKIKPGDVIADVGAGSGYHTFRLAAAVGPTGKVYANDIQKEMLDLIRKRMEKEKVTNIETILGSETDAKLPENKVDLILLVDVYHEFSQPYEMTEAMLKSLKPGGRMVFVEYRMEDPKVPIKLVHKMSQKQVIKEMDNFPSLKYAKTIDVLPWQHIIIFEKKADKSEEKK